MASTWLAPPGQDPQSWLDAREPSLHRLAVLLSGDAAKAPTLLRPALAEVVREWRRIGPVDAEDRATGLVFAEHRRTWDRRASETSDIGLSGVYDDAGAAAAELLESLPARERAIAVARHYVGLDEGATARLLRLRTALVAGEDREVLTALRLQLDRQRVRHPERAIPADPAVVLSETLRAQAMAVEYVPTTPEDLQAGGRRERARRRGVAALVAAVVVAGVAAAAAIADPVAPAPDGPSRDPEFADVLGPLAAYERSGRPLVPYLADRTLLAPDGSRREVPVRPRTVTRVGDSLWVTDLYGAEQTLRRLDRVGREIGSWPTSGDPVLSADGTRLAWVELLAPDAGRARLHLGSATQDVAGPVELVGIVGGRVVYNAGPSGRPSTTDLRRPPQPVPIVSRVATVDAVTGAVAGRADGGEWVVIDVASRRVRWRSADWRLVRFSPDGRHLFAVSAGGTRVVNAILDARTGAAVTTIDWDGPGPGVLDVRWEDDEHLLMLATTQGQSTFLRTDLDGTLTRAMPPLPADEVGNSTYRFALR